MQLWSRVQKRDMLLTKSKETEHRKTVCRRGIEKSGMTDHLWKEKGTHLPLWDEVKIIDRKDHWRIRYFKEAACMFLQ